MLKAVIFDVDGVLIDSYEANLRFYQDLMVSAGYSPPTRESYRHMYHMTMRDVIKHVTNSHDEKEIEKIWLLGKNRYVSYHHELITSPKKYKSVLYSLHKKYILAIVTSRITGGVFSLPQLSELESLFKTIVYYEDTAKHKPEPDPLLLACERLALKPEEAVYIGDTNTDVQAAKAAEMNVIIYSKKAISGADANTELFDQIPKLIDTLNEGSK